MSLVLPSIWRTPDALLGIDYLNCVRRPSESWTDIFISSCSLSCIVRDPRFLSHATRRTAKQILVMKTAFLLFPSSV